jgi:branched-chain amino acid transport system substrate-binding protein
MGGQTGPAAASVIQLFQELEYTLKYTNEVEGGVGGMKLDWKVVDNKGTLDGARSAYLYLRESYQPQLYIVVEDYYYLAMKDLFEKDNSVVFTTSNLDPRCFVPPSRFFSVSIPTSDGFAGYVTWVKQNWKGAGQPKIGVLYWDLASGTAWQSAQSWALKQGVTLDPVQYSMASVDLKAPLLRLKNDGCTSVWMLAVTQTAALAVRDMNSLGLTTTMPMTFNEFVEADVLLGLAGSSAQGFTIIRSESPYADNSQAAQLYTKIWKWATGKDRWSDNRLVINMKAAITAAINKAAANVGKDKIDGAAVYDALNQLPTIDTWGNSGIFGYGPGRRIGIQQIKISRLTDKATVSASDWITTPRTFEMIDK